jgi:uncharacterized repeat protein (TIGR03803 family)
VALLAAAAWSPGDACAAEQVLYRFAGGNDGAQPAAGLIADNQGNLYGTTSAGGGSGCGGTGCGTVFELSPKNGAWAETVLHVFESGKDGAEPVGGLISDAAGNLYGATVAGGDTRGCSGCGTVFEVSPMNGGWKETVLYAFSGKPKHHHDSNLFNPSGLAFGADGNLYGFSGGDCKKRGKLIHCDGGAFELTQAQKNAWSETIIYPFRSGFENPYGLPVFDAGGNLYGLAEIDFGAVFQLQPPTGQGAWTGSIAYAFQDGNDGAIPSPGLAFDTSGNLYGATVGWQSAPATVFELTPAQNGPWTETTLYTFADSADGTDPAAGPVVGTDGDLYGTTRSGGQNGHGVVYALSPQNGGWSESVLYSFAGGSDGAAPAAGLLMGKDNALYGTTLAGGNTGCAGGAGCGTVFEVNP